MKKIKMNEKGKTIAVSAVSIGLLSAMFIGVNSLVFAAESGKTETLTPEITETDLSEDTELNGDTDAVEVDENISPDEEITAVEVEEDTALSEDFKAPSLTIHELPSELDNERKESAMSYDDAAQIGAQHIWEIYGESIDGMFVSMFYEESKFTNRTYWEGNVFVSQNDMDHGDPVFAFIVDAVSGEKKSAQLFQDVPFHTEEEQAKEPYLDNTEKLVEISMEYDQKRKEHYKTVYAADPEEYAQIAQEAAQKHFSGTDIAAVEYLEDRGGIVFQITDNTGHAIEVAVHSDTKDVEFIDDRMDEYDPNFVPAQDAVG